MKRIVSCILALCFAVTGLCFGVSANYVDHKSTEYIQNGMNAHDLGVYGGHTFVSYRTETPPVLDGAVSTGEYPAVSDVASVGDGLYVTNSTGNADYTATEGTGFSDFTVTTYLAYDNEYAYIAEVIASPTTPISVTTYSGGTSTLTAHVRYGLNQSAEIPEAASRLSNTYAYSFDGNDFMVSACSGGNRTYRTIENATTQTTVLDDDCYVDANSTVWNMAQYAQNAAIGTQTGAAYTYTLEYRIPLADIAYSATGSYDPATVPALLASGSFYGSYVFQIAVSRTAVNGKTQVFLSTAIPANATVTPYTTYGTGTPTTWAQAVKDYWTTPKGKSLSISYVPSPVLHAGALDPMNPVTISTSGFRPGVSGYGFKDFKPVARLGDPYAFSVYNSGLENTSPAYGDTRFIPTLYRFRSGSTTAASGSFNSDWSTATVDTKSFKAGVYSLVVSFTEQMWDGSNWVNTGFVKNLSQNINFAGSVLGTSAGAGPTGDAGLVLMISIGAMTLCAASITVIVLKKKKVK